MKINKLNKEKSEEVCRQLWDLKDSLIGISGLITQGASQSPCYSNDEIYGLGILVKKMSEDVFRIEQILFQKNSQD